MTEPRLTTIIFFAAIFALNLLWGDEAGAAAEGQKCGTLAGIPCDEGLWCDPDPGRCNVTDVAGVCVKTGPICPKDSKDYRPVCGCDDHTYSNDCQRRAAKVAKAADGACDPETCKEKQDPVCGTKDGERVNYNNECKAKRSGATNITKGAC